MDYRSALEYIRDRSDYDRGFISDPFAGDDAAAAGLSRTRRLLDALGSPDRAYPIIHVAGTKGKGSTCAFIESAARHAGLRTGLFTTPHLHTMRERLQIDRELISEEEWARVTARIAAAVGDVERDHPDLGRITAFELNTAMALLWFAEQEVDIGVIEVGLGGRLDATNVVQPAVAVITPVSFDHQAILGGTLAEIASEKAGIIKQGVPVVVSPQEPEAMQAIIAAATEKGARLHPAGSHWHAVYRNQKAALYGPWGELLEIEIGPTGRHQAANACAALMALWVFDRQMFSNGTTISDGLRATSWPGRFETVHQSPRVIVDGAHNGASMHVLARTLLDEVGAPGCTFVFGSYVDKNLEAMLSAIAPLAARVIATKSGSPRARPASDIANAAEALGIATTQVDDIQAALKAAIAGSEPSTVIVATGSLSIVAEAREYFGLGAISRLEREILAG